MLPAIIASPAELPGSGTIGPEGGTSEAGVTPGVRDGPADTDRETALPALSDHALGRVIPASAPAGFRPDGTHAGDPCARVHQSGTDRGAPRPGRGPALGPIVFLDNPLSGLPLPARNEPNRPRPSGPPRETNPILVRPP